MAVIQRQTDCCIAGGGPAGIMLGLLLAREGVDTTVVEKHRDFFRDFRGDTIHPSTLDLLDDLGLRSAFARIRQHSITTLDIVVDGIRLTPVDFRTLCGNNRRIALMPQWDFLNLLATEARTLNNFHLLMETEAVGLLHDAELGTATPGGRVTGLRARGPDGALEIRAAVSIAADGRASTIRAAANLRPRELGAPIDVLWFRLPTPPSPPPDTLGYLRAGTILITIPRNDYYQMGMLIPKGSFEHLQSGGLARFRERIRAVAPFLTNAVESLTAWDQVKLLSVQLDRLERWSVPGLWCIGDAAHAMSPVFGVGVNYAVQDAVAAARLLAPALTAGAATGAPAAPSAAQLISTAQLIDDAGERFQRRRQRPVRLMQPLQQLVHSLLSAERFLSVEGSVLAGGVTRGDAADLHLEPWQARLATLASKTVRPVTARVVGRGFLPEKLHHGHL